MPLRIEPPARPLAPRWAVVCWIAALHCLAGRPDLAEFYMVDLTGLVFEGFEATA